MHLWRSHPQPGPPEPRKPRRGLRKYASTPRMWLAAREEPSEPIEPPELPELPKKRSHFNLRTPPKLDIMDKLATYTMNQPPTASPDLHHDTEDETSSETHEPITPNSDSLPHSVPLFVSASKPQPAPIVPIEKKPTNPVTPNKARPKPLVRQSTASKISKFFHRKGHDSTEETPAPVAAAARVPSPDRTPAEPTSTGRRFTISKSADASPSNSVTHSPPNGRSPTSTVNQAQPDNWLTTPAEGEEDLGGIKRASTGLKVKGIVFNLGHNKGEARPRNHHRSSSMSGMDEAKPMTAYSITADAGVGLKARRMSASLPENFIVDSVELNNEFSSSSIVPGRRGKTVGKGATASVKLMCKKGGPSDVLYAVKEFRKRTPDENERDYERKVMSEYCIAKSLHHPNIVESVRLCTHSNRWNHVMEYVPLEVHTLVSKGYLKTEDQNCIFKQLVRAVSHLHSHGIAHRDIKLENMLMTLDGQVKLTDFGVSEVFCGDHPGVRAAAGQCGRNMKECKKCAPGVCGSPPYLPPEVMAKEEDYDPRLVDVWSCAMVLLTLRFNGQIWMAPDESEQYYKVFSRGWRTWLAAHEENPIPTSTADLPKCGPAFGNLKLMAEKRCVLRMLHPTPEKRMTIAELQEDNWFKGIDCCSPESSESCAAVETTLDASTKKGCKLAAKTIRRAHHHLPPAVKVPTFGIHLKDAD